MQRILFVDDEPAVLDGLRNVLRKDRSRWEMVFVGGGEAALEELKKSPFDVVVSDMRMPGMDGAQLLRRVKDDYPAIVRIVLSGHAWPEAVANVLPVVNQFVAKPCDVTTLQAVIERGCQLRALLENGRSDRTIDDAGLQHHIAIAILCPRCKRCEVRSVTASGAPLNPTERWDAPCPGRERAGCGSGRTVTLLRGEAMECDFAGLSQCEMSRCPQQAH